MAEYTKRLLVVDVSGNSMAFSLGGKIEGMSEDENRALTSWYWYDWANQAFALTVGTVLGGQLITRYFNLATGGSSEIAGFNVTGTSFYAAVLGLSMVFVAISSPILGAIADRIRIKKKIVWIYTLLGVVFTAFMGVAPHLDEDSAYRLLAFCFLMGQIGMAGGNTIYYAFMPYLAEENQMEKVSSWGFAYGFAGGTAILILHLIVLATGAFGMTEAYGPWTLTFAFVTTSLWWLGFGLPFFRNTPEPEIANERSYGSIMEAVSDGFREVRSTFREVKKYRILVIYLLSYLLFYDVLHTVGGVASSFAENDLRLPVMMNFALILLANIIAIPMSVVGGILAARYGAKSVLGGSIGVYMVVLIIATGFAPLDLEDDHDRFDFRYDYHEESGEYVLSTLHDRGVKGWVSKSGPGDEEFRNTFLDYMIEGDLDGDVWTDSDIERTRISVDEATLLASEMDGMKEHRWSFSFKGGDLDGESSVGDSHITVIEGGPIDWWPNFLRDNVWSPLNIGVTLQWLILGTLVGFVQGSAGAQARSLFAYLVPKSRTTEFFGFFGFMGKAAAVIGPFIFAFFSAAYDTRFGILVLLMILVLGLLLFPFIDVEEGKRVARQADIDAGLYSEE
ncbi:MAG: MFS transporter [Candidatus Thalassarchaeaceae archaeon]